MKKRRIVIDFLKCTGCRLCEMACSINLFGEFNPYLSNISVMISENGEPNMPVTCMQCEEPFCVPVCPAGAFDVDNEGIVVLTNKCVGCKMCLMVCPFGNIHYLRSRVVKCDLCGGDPECVKICPSGALVYGEVNELPKNRKNILKSILASYRQMGN